MQAQCLQLGDSVSNRFHWPKSAELRVNNMSYRVYQRDQVKAASANQRDEPAVIASLCFTGRNRLTLSCRDSNTYCIIVQVGGSNWIVLPRLVALCLCFCDVQAAPFTLGFVEESCALELV